MKGGGAVYCLGILGAIVYYVQQAVTFGDGIVGIIKAFIWPALLVHRLLGFLGM